MTSYRFGPDSRLVFLKLLSQPSLGLQVNADSRNMSKTATVFVCVLALIGCGSPADAAPMFRDRSLLPINKGRSDRAETLQLKIDRLRAAQQKFGDSSSLKADLSFECDVCDVIMVVIQQLFLREKTEEEVESICTSVCVELKMYDHSVCSMGVQEFKVSNAAPPTSHPPPSPFHLTRVVTWIPPVETFTNGIKNFDRRKSSLIA